MIYLDNASTTRISDKAKEAMMSVYDDFWANPSSIHTLGQRAKSLLEASRKKIADILGVNSNEIYFTSGGSESNSQVLFTMNYNNFKVAVSKIEHHSILNSVYDLGNYGLIDVDSEGIVLLDNIHKEIRNGALFISVMCANNEIGTIQPIDDIAHLCHGSGIMFHTDATQAIGHIPINFRYIDYLSLSAHKFNGPKGIGILYAKKGVLLSSFIKGGSQEREKRAGTENIPAVVGMAVALEEAYNNMTERNKKTTMLRDRLFNGIKDIPDIIVNGSLSNRLSCNLNVWFEGCDSESLLMLLNERGICASAGSACMAMNKSGSYVVLSLDGDFQRATQSLRFSLSHENSELEIDQAIIKIKEAVKYLRKRP